MSKLCNAPSCYALALPGEGYCSEHIESAKRRAALRAEQKPFATAKAPNAQLYKTYRWHKLSKRIREENPQCQRCGSEVLLQVHHTIEGELTEEQFFDEENLVVLCRPCHQTITQLHTVRRRS